MRHRNVLGALVAVAMTVTITASATAIAGPAGAAPPIPTTANVVSTVDTAGAARARTVTLITGDRVTSYATGKLSVVARKGVQFVSYRNAGHQYVIPTDALALLRADRLDRRLFDITELTASGYDRRAYLPVIVSGGAAVKGQTGKRNLAAVRGYATSMKVDSLAGNWRSTRDGLSAGKVWLDGLRKPSLDVSVPQIGAPAAWAAGFDGTGVKVAVLDTGIDGTHPDLSSSVIAEHNFTEGNEDDLDHVGHGTHVASTIAGTGAGSAGKYRGVAPGARLLDGKVCVMDGCAESWILAGMQWAAESGANVVNLSLGGQDSPEVDPLEQAINDLSVQYSVLFVVAAGNSGSDNSVGSPASADAALAVGAVTKTDELAEFSSRGPRTGDNALKPEITAPGVDIVAARSKDTTDGTPGQLYVSHSGTSMATPHVAGAAAILTQVHPQWTAQQRKAALMAAAKPNPAIGVFAQGAGRVDVARAYQQTITTAPASISYGLQDFPHDDDEVLSRDFAYHNPTAAAVTLNLALTTTAPAGMFTLSTSTVTVPANGDAAVSLSADTRVGGDLSGGFGGQVTATAAGISVQTPFGVVRDSRKVKVHVTTTNRAGAPAVDALTVLVNTDTFSDYATGEPDATLRVVPGHYFAFSFVPDVNDSVNLLVHAQLTVDADQDLAMDGKKARGFDVTVPDPAAKPASAILDVTQEVDQGGLGVTILGAGFGNLYGANLGPANTPGLLSVASGVFAKPDGKDGFTNSPFQYQVGWYQTGAVQGGVVQHVRQRDLSTVRSGFGLNAVGAQGVRVDFGVAPGSRGGWGNGYAFDLPFKQTEYFAGSLAWQTLFEELIAVPDSFPDLVSLVSGPVTSYVAGRHTEQRWNNAVFAPNTASEPESPSVFRLDNDIYAFPSVFADASGRQGFVNYASARAALYRDNQLVGESTDPGGVFTVPAQQGQYRLEVRSSQIPAVRLSTRIDCVWTFRSARVDAQTLAPLPLTAVGFATSLDERNTARAGSVAITPIIVSQQQGSGAGKVTKINVDVSYDDGATWTKAPVVHTLGKWLLVLQHRNRPGFVSLRAKASDTAGNTVTETVIRAYELR